MDTGLMARPKAVPQPQPEPPQRDVLVSFRCSKAFKEHLEAIAEKEDRNTTQVTKRALRDYAEKNGYEPFPAS